MKPELREIYDSRRTASKRGHAGHNTAWDWMLERQNREYSQALGANISESRLLSIGQILNGTRHIRNNGFEYLGVQDEISEYNGIKDSDVEGLVAEMQAALKLNGDQDHDLAELRKKRSSNPFKRGNGASPWERIASAETKESTGDYVRRILRESAPDSTIQ